MACSSLAHLLEQQNLTYDELKANGLSLKLLKSWIYRKMFNHENMQLRYTYLNLCAIVFLWLKQIQQLSSWITDRVVINYLSARIWSNEGNSYMSQ